MLKEWRIESGMTQAECAKALGLLGGARSFQRIEVGETGADADMVERIRLLTSGAVTPNDMHAIRLDWLKANRPEKFEGSSPDGVPHGASVPAGPDAPETQSGPAFSCLDVLTADGLRPRAPVGRATPPDGRSALRPAGEITVSEAAE